MKVGNRVRAFPICLIGIFVILFFSGCNKLRRDNRSLFQKYYGTTLDLVDSLKYFKINSGEVSEPDLQEFKIVTYIDASCSGCLDELLQWNALIDDMRFEKVSFLIYI